MMKYDNKIRYMTNQGFYKEDFRGMDFSGAKLTDVSFSQCDFRNTKFTGTVLNRVSFRGCLFDIYRCEDYVEIVPFYKEGIRTDFTKYNNDRENTRILFFSKNMWYHIETEGEELVVYKKIYAMPIIKSNLVLAKLNIPAYAERIVFKNGICRASCAQVLDIFDIYGNHYTKGMSAYYGYYGCDRTYNVGHMIYADSFDDDPFKICAHGIHFFLTEREAQNY